MPRPTQQDDLNGGQFIRNGRIANEKRPGFAVPMTKALALRPREKHPLHIAWEFEVWPVEPDAGASGALRARVLAGLPRLERADEVAWSSVALCSDTVLQEIFHTDDHLTPADVPRLCCELPGIDSCLLTRRNEVLATWNEPLDLDQEELLRAASSTMDRAVEARSAGWGDARGVTVFLDGGSASLLRCGTLQLLVLHGSRGFAPGVREKLSSALAAVAAALRSAP